MKNDIIRRNNRAKCSGLLQDQDPPISPTSLNYFSNHHLDVIIILNPRFNNNVKLLINSTARYVNYLLTTISSSILSEIWHDVKIPKVRELFWIFFTQVRLQLSRNQNPCVQNYAAASNLLLRQLKNVIKGISSNYSTNNIKRFERICYCFIFTMVSYNSHFWNIFIFI